MQLGCKEGSLKKQNGRCIKDYHLLLVKAEKGDIKGKTQLKNKRYIWRFMNTFQRRNSGLLVDFNVKLSPVCRIKTVIC